MAEDPSIRPPQGAPLKTLLDAVEQVNRNVGVAREEIRQDQIKRTREPGAVGGGVRGGGADLGAASTAELERRVQLFKEGKLFEERGARAEYDRLQNLKASTQEWQRQINAVQRYVGIQPVQGVSPSARVAAAPSYFDEQTAARTAQRDALAQRLAINQPIAAAGPVVPVYGPERGRVPPSEAAARQKAAQETQALARTRRLDADAASAAAGEERRLSLQFQQGAAIQAQASQQMRRHGALTTEFLEALARGETTLSEFRFQIGSTIAKFGGWTAAATAVYGVVGALAVLARGGKDTASGIQQLHRFISDVSASDAAKGFRDTSREVNVSIADVAEAQAQFLRVYRDQGQSLEAARTALKLTKLDNISVADSLRYLTASAQEFKLPASEIIVLGDKLANVFRTMGVPIQESLPAFARSAAVVRNVGGDLTQLVELIAVARRQTGQTGNVIGTALARSAANFVNRPSSQDTIRRLGLDPKLATTQYTEFVISAIRRAKDLSAPEIRDLAAAIGGPQYGARIFTGLLRGYALLPKAAQAAGSAAAGTLDYELRIKLAQVDEQIKAVANGMERIGSGLAQSGAFAPLGLALHTLNAMLSVTTDLIDAFDKLPGPVRQLAAYGGEAYVALRLLRRTGLGTGLAERTGIQSLAYSPQEQLRRGAIFNARNVDKVIADEQEGVTSNLTRVRLQLVTQAGDQSAITALTAREVQLHAEYVALEEARLRNQALLVGLQKRNISVADAAARSPGGALVVAGPRGAPRVVTDEEAAQIEGRDLGSVRQAAQGLEPGALGLAAGGGAAARDLSRAQTAAAKAKFALTEVGTGARALGAGLIGLVSDPLILGLIGFEAIPAIYNARTNAIKRHQAELERLSQGPQNQAQANALANQAPAPTTAYFGARSVPVPIDDAALIKNKTAETERKIRDAQDLARASGQPVPLRFTANIIAGLQRDVDEFRKGRISAAELVAAQRQAAKELDRSREAVYGTAAGAQAVSEAAHRMRQVMLEAARNSSEIAASLKGASLKDLATALGDETAAIAVFGEPKQLGLHKIAAQFARATRLVAQDPSAQNLKDYAQTKQDFDQALQEFQTEFQQALTLASNQAERDRAYATYSRQLGTGLPSQRGNLRAAQSDRGRTSSRLDTARQGQKDLQEQYNAAVLGTTGLQDDLQQFESQLGLQPGVLGGPARIKSAELRLQAAQDRVKELRTKLSAQGKEVDNLTDALRKRQREVDAARKDLEQTRVREDNQIAQLQAQIQAGRATDPVAGLLIQLRAAHQAVTNDVLHTVGQEQRLQDELNVQNLENQLLQTRVQTIQSRGDLRTSQIDPADPAAVQRSQLATLRDELRAARGGPRGAARSDQIRQILTQIHQAEFQLQDTIRQQAQQRVDAYYQYLESQTDDPLKIARLEYQNALKDVSYAHTRTERLQAQARSNQAQRNIYQTYAQDRLDTINFEASIGKLTTDQEIAALRKLLRYQHLTRDIKRSILQQIYQLSHQDQNEVELNVGDIRLPTLYDVRRLARLGTNQQPVVSQSFSFVVEGADDPEATASAVAERFHQTSKTHLKSAMRAAGMRG